jgi:hypothetical protein
MPRCKCSTQIIPATVAWSLLLGATTLFFVFGWVFPRPFKSHFPFLLKIPTFQSLSMQQSPTTHRERFCHVMSVSQPEQSLARAVGFGRFVPYTGNNFGSRWAMRVIFEQLSHFEGSEGGLLAPVEPKHCPKSLTFPLYSCQVLTSPGHVAVKCEQVLIHTPLALGHAKKISLSSPPAPIFGAVRRTAYLYSFGVQCTLFFDHCTPN